MRACLEGGLDQKVPRIFLSSAHSLAVFVETVLLPHFGAFPVTHLPRKGIGHNECLPTARILLADLDRLSRQKVDWDGTGVKTRISLH
jgi:hypothetical protein